MKPFKFQSSCFLLVCLALLSCEKDESPKKEINTEIKVTSLGISAETTILQKGSTTQLAVEVLPTNATNKAITLTSGDETIATVDADGIITGLAAGQVVITGRSDENHAISDSLTLQIEDLETNSFFNFSVLAEKDNMRYEIDIIDGSADDQTWFDISNNANLSTGHRYKIGSQSVYFWKDFVDDEVLKFDVLQNEIVSWSNYFQLADGYYNPCIVPTENHILTFYVDFNIANSPPIQQNYVNIYDKTSDTSINVDLPDGVLNCSQSAYLSDDNFILFEYYVDSMGHIGILDIQNGAYLQSVLYSGGDYTLIEQKIVQFPTTNLLRIFNLETFEFEDDVILDVSVNPQGTGSLQVISQNEKLFFFNDVFNGDANPSIFNLQSTTLTTYLYEDISTAYNLDGGNYNLKLIDALFDFELESMIFSYEDFDVNGQKIYGILFFDFDLNLTKRISLDDYKAIELIKH